MTKKDHVREAIQKISNNTGQKEIIIFYCHTGWKKINNEWVYLSGGGAIGSAKDVNVSLPQNFHRYNLPKQSENEVEAIRISLSFLELADREITLPLYSFLFLSVLTTLLKPIPNFSAYLYGDTGTFKTTLSLMLLSHFGDFTDPQELSNFEDSANSIEKNGFLLKDNLMVLDDHHPSIKKVDADSKKNLAQRAIRAFANRTGRGRLNADTTLKATYFPRGLLLVTGEEIITLQSTLARVMIVEINKGDVNKARLTELQSKASLLPHAMTSFILWVKRNMEEITSNFKSQFVELRGVAGVDGLHGRYPEQIAFLQYGLNTIASWLIDKGIFLEQEAEELTAVGWNIFKKVAENQNKRLEREDPMKRFAEIIQTAIAQGKAKLEHKGEYRNEIRGGEFGELIGYFDDCGIYYLLPEAVWNLLSKFCIGQGEHFPISRQSFYRQLQVKGIIEAGQGQTTKQERIRGQNKRVLKIIKPEIFEDMQELTVQEEMEI
ncbi:MAG: hypothetical protein HZA08_08980 [Nitrospirae bacterium]|nr:hypothetical protein [Nitrospirota bacterium]